MAEPDLSVASQQKHVAEARAAQDKSAEAVALMMLSQAFFEADRVAEARQTYLEAAQVARGEVNRHQIRLAQSEALMVRGIELVETEPFSQSAYRAFFSAGVVLEELEDDGRAAREDAYARANAIRDPYAQLKQQSSGSGPVRGSGRARGSGLAAIFGVRAKADKREGSEKAPAASSHGAHTVRGRDRERAGVDPAIRDALARRQRRAEAREILETDPALARELRIGRPDLPHRYDDGGILDVNHVPAKYLAALPGFTPELAARIVELRAEYGRFMLLSELVVYADVPEDLAEELSDRLVFLS